MTDIDSTARAEPRTQPSGVSFWIKIVIFNLADDTIYRETRTNYNLPASREWLFKTLVWAWTNGKSVELYNENDEKLIQGKD